MSFKSVLTQSFFLMNLMRFGKDTVKNSTTEEYDVPQNLDLLNKWTIPRIEPRIIYKLGTFEKIGLKQIVKTSESSIPLNDEEMVIKLLCGNDLVPFKRTHKFIHIGCIQVAFRPLTLEGLPESFLAALRDGRNLDWKQSIIGMIQSSLAHGPVYFDVYPNLCLSLSDPNILDALTLNVRTNGYNYTPGTEVICICYRIYYKPLYTLNPLCKRVDKDKNETVLIETNFNKSNITTRRSIKWDEIVFPNDWTITKDVKRNPIIQSDFSHITQTNDGAVRIQFNNSQNRLLPPGSFLSRTSSSRTHMSPIDYIVDQQSARASTSYIREEEEESQNLETQEPLRNIRVQRNGIVGICNTQRVGENDTMSNSDFV